MTEWEKDAQGMGWIMPAAPRWKRLPIIRHIRAMALSFGVARHNRFYRSIGKIPTGYDSWVLHGIWIGKERDE